MLDINDPEHLCSVSGSSEDLGGDYVVHAHDVNVASEAVAPSLRRNESNREQRADNTRRLPWPNSLVKQHSGENECTGGVKG